MNRVAPVVNPTDDDWEDLENAFELQLADDPTTLSIDCMNIPTAKQYLNEELKSVETLSLINFTEKPGLNSFVDQFGLIKELRLTNCSLDQIQLDELVILLKNNRRINSLQFEWTKDSKWIDLVDQQKGDKKVIDTWISKLISSIHEYSIKIKLLRIQGYSFTDNQFEGLVTSIIGNEKLGLVSLLFPQVVISKSALDSFIQILKSKTSIRFVYLPSCTMNDTEVTSFVSKLHEVTEHPSSQIISLQAPYDIESFFSSDLKSLVENRWKLDKIVTKYLESPLRLLLKFEFQFQIFITNSDLNNHQYSDAQKTQRTFYKKLKESDPIIFNDESRLFDFKATLQELFLSDDFPQIFSSIAIKRKKPKTNKPKTNKTKHVKSECKSSGGKNAETTVTESKFSKKLANLPPLTPTQSLSCSRDEIFTYMHSLDQLMEIRSTNDSRISDACVDAGIYFLEKLYPNYDNKLPSMEIGDTSPRPKTNTWMDTCCNAVSSFFNLPLVQGILVGVVGVIPVIQVSLPASSSSKNDDSSSKNDD